MSLLAIVKTKDNNCNNIYLQIIKYLQSDGLISSVYPVYQYK